MVSIDAGVSVGIGCDEEKTFGREVCRSLGAGMETDSCDGMLKRSTDSAGEDSTGFVRESGWS